MKAFTQVISHVAPLDRPNVDTDAIIPKQYLKSIRRTGFGPFLFDDWRYLDPGTLEVDPATRRPNPEFVLNEPKHAGAQVLIARDNFGCGSSREHAVWALDDYGFRAVIAPSFADIFFSNCFKNGVLPVTLQAEEVQAIFEAVAADAAAKVTIDLPAQEVRLPDGRVFRFQINPHHKHNMVNGLDEIGLTLQQADAIRAYEAKRRAEAPWLFN
ncbi:3-isopropylmalate dehydratase small subunit [Solimonas fluminis]|uniref:3-isopropylmalate dehydratase small subunit n=1 Tax=Solimonas fluminis TaxID=2086571 RepID=A0A2S5TAR7_9GAMM|nr:3-isopropylmalate dehydratase small subunit [Solimonas fluminis]PPE71937.1 3-isopropylmalate dehydratase small subunit [Solimonas fluminis]